MGLEQNLSVDTAQFDPGQALIYRPGSGHLAWVKNKELLLPAYAGLAHAVDWEKDYQLGEETGLGQKISALATMQNASIAVINSSEVLHFRHSTPMGTYLDVHAFDLAEPGAQREAEHFSQSANCIYSSKVNGRYAVCAVGGGQP